MSIIFLDASKEYDHAIFLDASKLGEKIKEGKNQRTLLSLDEEKQIVEAFNSDEDIEDFSVYPVIDEVKEKNYSLSAGQYFEIKPPIINISEEEFTADIAKYAAELDTLFKETSKLECDMKNNLEKLKYE